MVTHDGTRPVPNIQDQSLSDIIDQENGMGDVIKTTKLTQMYAAMQEWFRKNVVTGKYIDDEFEEAHILSKVFNNTIAVTIFLVNSIK